MSYEIGNFSADTSVSPDPARPGRYRGHISPNWNVLYVFGGVTMATAVSAARSALGQREFELLSAHATFLAPIQSGAVTLDVKPLRAGKGSEQFTVDMRAGEGEHSDLHLSCTFGPKRDHDARFTDLQFPDVPPPERVERPKPPPGFGIARLPYHYSVETRPVLGNLGWDTEWEAGPARWMAWHRLRNNPRLDDGSLDPLAYVPAADMVGFAFRQGVGPRAKPSMVISLDISLHVFARTDSEWLLQDTQVTQTSDGYLSGIVHLWDERGLLVASALQRAMLRTMMR